MLGVAQVVLAAPKEHDLDGSSRRGALGRRDGWHVGGTQHRPRGGEEEEGPPYVGCVVEKLAAVVVVDRPDAIVAKERRACK